MNENFSQKLFMLRRASFKNKINKAVGMLTDPHDSVQINNALKYLDNSKQRVVLLDRIIYLRDQKSKRDEESRFQQMKPLLQRVSKKLSHKTTGELKFEKVVYDMKKIQTPQRKAVSKTSLSCLTTELEAYRETPINKSKQQMRLSAILNTDSTSY
ncbi:hypothetical protein pb186bvf_015848 [Paramecium bursaria]